MGQRQLVPRQGRHLSTLFLLFCFVRDWCNNVKCSHFHFFSLPIGKEEVESSVISSFSLSDKVFSHSSATDPLGAACVDEAWRMKYLVVIDLRRWRCPFPQRLTWREKTKCLSPSLFTLARLTFTRRSAASTVWNQRICTSVCETRLISLSWDHRAAQLTIGASVDTSGNFSSAFTGLSIGTKWCGV